MESFFRISVPAVAEQVIDVPKLAFPILAVQRAALLEPQLVEQLVEVPTVLSVAVLQQRTAEQIIGFPIPGRGGGARGGLQGLSHGQGSSAVSGADYVDTPVPGRGGGARGGLQGFSQGQGSTAVSGADYVDTPVLRVVEEVLVKVFSQGQGSTAVCGAEHVDTPVPHGGDLHGLSQGQGSTALCGADHVDIPVPHGRVGERGLQGFPRGQGSTASAVEQTIGVDRGGLQGFPSGQSSTASAVEQTFSHPHRSKPRAPVHGRHDEWVCVVDVENDGEYYWNRRDNPTCWRLPRGVKHRWCLLAFGLYRDVALQVDYRVLPPL